MPTEPDHSQEPRMQYYTKCSSKPVERQDNVKNRRYTLTSKKSRSSSYQRRIQQKRLCLSLDSDKYQAALETDRVSITNRSDRSNLSLTSAMQYRNSIRPIANLNQSMPSLTNQQVSETSNTMLNSPKPRLSNMLLDSSY